jgi:hypothetical protein
MNEFQVGDLVEDREGDKAIVVDVGGPGLEDGPNLHVRVEWKCRPHVPTGWIPARIFENLSEYVRELDRDSRVERRAIETLARGEWPDSQVHGRWRAQCMIRWLRDAGIGLVEIEREEES